MDGGERARDEEGVEIVGSCGTIRESPLDESKRRRREDAGYRPEMASEPPPVVEATESAFSRVKYTL